MIDINKLTLGELKEIQSILNLSKSENKNDLEIHNGRYVIVRTYSAGVFAGNLHSQRNQEINLKNARRLWKWSGAASLSQLAMEGVKNPDECMFPCEVESITLLQAIEIINCTERAKNSIKNIKIWEK